MTARQLRLLLIFGLKDIADAVQQLDIALPWVLSESGDEGPGHGSRSLGVDGGIGGCLFIFAA
jgi:hypothetical protein